MYPLEKVGPSLQPIRRPTDKPSSQPTMYPTRQPSTQPSSLRLNLPDIPYLLDNQRIAGMLVFLSLGMSVLVSTRLSLFVFPVCLSICLSVCLYPVCVCLSVCPYLFTCPSVCLHTEHLYIIYFE